MRILVISVLLLVGSMGCRAQLSKQIDGDDDGLADSLEQSLLERFAPHFLISKADCSSRPAEFMALAQKPIAVRDNSTIYGQAFPFAGHADLIELHFYDLWRRDCGQAGHDLDAEHVSALVARDEAGSWRARYWYAAAHEDTLCDASQIAAAKGLDAEDRGPEVWISAGKHAAFLSKVICKRACGADDCSANVPLTVSQIVNVGEAGRPMNGATWAASSQWPLRQKMTRSDFNDDLISRLDHLSGDEIAWVNPGKRPAQQVILGGDAALVGASTGLHATDSALSAADTNTAGALDTASRKTGNAVLKSYSGLKKALKAASGRQQPKSQCHDTSQDGTRLR